jgi:hypothetical protein
MIHGSRITTFCIAILLSLASAAIAAELTIPNSFSNGEPADADEVNANFNAVKTAVDDNNQKITDLSQPRSASVTFSAMGFSPAKGEAERIAIIGSSFVVENYENEFEKDAEDCSLAILNGDSGAFYHSVPLRTGIIITRIRARVRGAVTVSLKKEGDADPLATVTATGSDEQIIEVDNIDHTIEEFPASYFIEVLLSGSAHRFYSAAIDYTYTEP